MGRDKPCVLRALAQQLGRLAAASAAPDDAAIVAALGQGRCPGRRVASSTISSGEPHRVVVKRWFYAGVQGHAIHAALKREHAFAGSYSAVVTHARPDARRASGRRERAP